MTDSGDREDDSVLSKDDTLAWEKRMSGFLRKPLMSLEDLEHPFRTGEIINHRFEIIGEIGHGGMGVVYAAFDRKRQQRIAIKAARFGFRRRLSPELESALKVRHRNICLVNEIHTASTGRGDIDFLTMEFLEGPTLQEHLASAGRLTPEEAMEIGRQLCAGLAEAHRIGIVHKDLKPGNVILSRAPDGASRAVITDFGLAGEPDAGAELAGTPRYMAPELWRGATASRATDLYALGVILQEMTAGGDRRLDAIIARCVDPSPSARPRDAAEVLAALAPPSPANKRVAAILMVAVLALAVGLIVVPKQCARPAIRLAILSPASSGDQSAIIQGALNDVADRLANRAEAPTLVVIRPSQTLASGIHTPEQARRLVGATHALQVTFRREGDQLVTSGAVIDLATQTRLEEISGRYPMSNAGDLSTALRGAVSKALRLLGEQAEPISRAANTPYLQGLSYLRRDQHSFDSAIPFFHEAITIDPHSPLPQAGLVEALVLKHKQTNDVRWLAEADRALQAVVGLDPDSVAVLLAAGRLNTARGNYEEALKSYQRVVERQPRNLEVRLRIAEVQQERGLHKEAIESYQQAISIDPRYYGTYEELGVFYSRRGEYAQAAEQFRKVIARAPRFYNAYTNLGATLNELGRDDEAVQALLTSLRIQENGGALNSLAAIKAYQKRDAEAIVYYRKRSPSIPATTSFC
jgi:serine/threonine protein kinase